jgi:hypothetical protein
VVLIATMEVMGVPITPTIPIAIINVKYVGN